MKKLMLFIIIVLTLSSCGCRWASRNCPGETITDTIFRVEIYDTTFFDTIIQPIPNRILKLKALALIDSLGYVQLPETTVTEHYGNSISVRIVHDTVYAESLNRDSLITVLKSNIRKEFRKEHISNSEQKTVIQKPSIRKKLITLIIILIIAFTIGYIYMPRAMRQNLFSKIKRFFSSISP
ncbi:MAG: hypothetical protein PF448_13135 [Bacteroidales bacterium]|jgi:hypothetical protein|nr:hypothetical protein [Bacteroidales bacterium]